MVTAIGSALTVSPPPLPLDGGIELLRVLHPLQQEVSGRKARDDPRRCADNRVEARVVPGVREAHERNRREDHRAHAPAGLTKCLVVFSTPQKIALMKIYVKPDQTIHIMPV